MNTGQFCAFATNFNNVKGECKMTLIVFFLGAFVGWYFTAKNAKEIVLSWFDTAKNYVDELKNKR